MENDLVIDINNKTIIMLVLIALFILVIFTIINFINIRRMRKTTDKIFQNGPELGYGFKTQGLTDVVKRSRLAPIKLRRRLGKELILSRLSGETIQPLGDYPNI